MDSNEQMLAIMKRKERAEKAAGAIGLVLFLIFASPVFLILGVVIF